MILSMPPAATCQYRVETATSKPPLSLIRKRCGRGVVVTARQLKQYGACDRCVKVAA